MKKVLLTRPVYKLGETGEVVEVKPGYARNYLIPQGIAVEPTPHNVRGLEKPKREREAELRTREEQARKLQEQLEGSALHFVRNAQEEGKLYGSVRVEDIVSAIEERTGHHLERDRVHLESPIDVLGTYDVRLTLYGDIEAAVQVVVVGEEGELGEEETPAEGDATE